MSIRLNGLISLATLVLAVSHPAGADDSCETAMNGVCEEMSFCLLGADSTDCRQACGPPWPEDLFGVCAHYAGRDSAPRPPNINAGTFGKGGPLGVWAGTLEAIGHREDTSITRHYKVYVPASYDPRTPTPLLYVLGGFTVDMYGLSGYTELLRTADLNNFMVVFPQQHFRFFGPDINWVFAWYIYKNAWSGGNWMRNPDVDFIRRLTTHLKSLYNLDRSRIFASGHSRGAGMSIILAFVLNDTIAGFVSESGFIAPNDFDEYITAREWERKVPGVLVHGRKDPDVPYQESEVTSDTLSSQGWVEGEDYLFFRLDNVAHEWQPQYNQHFWDFLMAHPLPLDGTLP